MKTSAQLDAMLRSIDHKGYPAYKSLKGIYSFGTYALSIDHVQGDPFASPSRLTIHISSAASGFSKDLWSTEDRKTAFCDFILRRFEKCTEQYSYRAKGSGKSGALSATKPGQEVLRRTACAISGENIIVRFEAGFPANGRTINAGELKKILFEFLPKCVSGSLFIKNTDVKAMNEAIHLYEDQQALRAWLKENGYIAFAADGAILPRLTGVSELPLADATPFRSPGSVAVTIPLPHRGEITGMGIKRGITLITGGGYHGKTTLLKALQAGVYNHIAGDGREFVIADDSAVKLRAEEGRIVKNTDISPFINNLPNGKSTKCFSTDDASVSTSQAAAVMEGIEAGTRLFLIDEDTCAANFMVRDELMQKVISPDKEPITPFISRISALYADLGISTILVAGSSGAYFKCADLIIQMDSYKAFDITERARSEAERYEISDRTFSPSFPESDISRTLTLSGSPYGRDGRPVKLKIQGKDGFFYGKEFVDLRYTEQLADEEQTRALAHILLFLHKNMDFKKPLAPQLTGLYEKLLSEGLESVTGSDCPPFMAMPRLFEIFACVNRCRF